MAAAKLGADLIYLNTAFAGPQLVDVLEREDPSVVIHDEEFTGMLEKAHVDQRVLSWADGETDADTLDSLIEGEQDDAPLDAPDHHTRIIILTSGTTGTPKGAPRNEAGIDAAISLLSRMPLKYGWRVHIAAPLFHTWGFAHLMLSLLLGHTIVLKRKFDPEDVPRAHRRAEVRRAGGDPGDAPAHPRAARRDPGPVLTRHRQGGRCLRLRTAR